MLTRFALYGFLKNQRYFEPFIILFFLQRGLSFTEIGLLIGFRELSINLMEVPSGAVADLFGRRRSMMLSFLAYIMSFAVFGFGHSYPVFMGAMFFFAVGEAFRTGTHKAMILEYLRIKGMEDRKVDYYGHTRAASQFGSAVNALISGIIVFYTGNYALIFLVAIIPYAIDIINVGTYPPELDGFEKRGERMKERLGDTLREFSGIFRNVNALRGVINSSFFDGSFEVSSNYLQPVLKTFALSLPVMLFLTGNERTAVVVGITYFFIYILTSFASSRANVVKDRIGNLPSAVNATFMAGALLIFLAGIFMAIEKSCGYFALLSIALFVLLYIVKNIRRPMNVGYISEQISHKTMASGLSVESLVKTLTAALLAPPIGWVADSYGVETALAALGVVTMAFYSIAKVR